jgi:hypothetical protein
MYSISFKQLPFMKQEVEDQIKEHLKNAVHEFLNTPESMERIFSSLNSMSDSLPQKFNFYSPIQLLNLRTSEEKPNAVNLYVRFETSAKFKRVIPGYISVIGANEKIEGLVRNAQASWKFDELTGEPVISCENIEVILTQIGHHTI